MTCESRWPYLNIKQVGMNDSPMKTGFMPNKKTLRSSPPAQDTRWTFLTNHAHVLICLARNPEIVLKDVALLVGITERAVQRIITELEEGGYLERFKEGRRNTYRLSLAKPLRHPLEKNHSVSELIRLIK